MRYSEYVPLGLGLRFYPAGVVGRAPGLYLDAIPVVHVSRIRDYSEPDWNTATWGFEAGLGARFGMWGTSRGEIGAVIYHIGGINENLAFADSWPSRPRTFQDRDVYIMRISFGLGD